MNTSSLGDDDIRAAYARLGESLDAPMDTLARIEHRVGVRRRRRRAAVAGVGTLGVLAVGGLVMAGLSGDDGTGQTVATEPPPAALSLTRPDGTTYTFEGVQVSCDPPDFAGGDPTGSGPDRIYAWSPMLLTEDEDMIRQPFVYLEGRVDKLGDDQTFTLPIDGPGDSQSYPLTLFVADTEGAADGNEVSSATGGAAGTVTIEEASCDPAPVLRLTVDATLGSEEGKQSLQLSGGLE